MAVVVYLLCTLTSGLCAVLLLREHRRRAFPLLFWSGMSFSLIAISNALVFLDFVAMPGLDLALPRAFAMTIAVSLLLYGLVWDAD